MASAIPSAIISDIRGSAGNQTWSRNKGGIYVKSRTAPFNPNTSGQQNSRSIIRNATSAWQSLSNDTRKHYNTVALSHTATDRLGRNYSLSGFNLFVRQFMWCSIIGSPLPTTVSQKIMKSLPLAVNVPIAVGSFNYHWQGYTFVDGNYFIFYGLKYRPASQIAWNPSNGRALFVLLDDTPSGLVNLDNAFNSILAPLSANVGKVTAIGLRVVNVLSGECSEITYQQRLITTTPSGWLNT